MAAWCDSYIGGQNENVDYLAGIFSVLLLQVLGFTSLYCSALLVPTAFLSVGQASGWQPEVADLEPF